MRLLSHNQVPDALTNPLCPRGLGVSGDRDDDEQSSHISQTIQAMSNFLRKRRPTADGTEIRPGSCTRLNYYPIRKLMAFRSEKATFHRCNEGDARHRKRVCRRFPASQIVFGGYQRSHKALRSTFPSNRATIWLIRSSQECKDVEEKLEDLIPWLTKLKDNVMTPSAGDSNEEAERLEQLTRFISYLYRLINSS